MKGEANVERPVEDVQDTQKVRLYGDLMLLAGYLTYVAVKGTITKLDSVILVLIAVLTFAYNYLNYKELES